MILRHQFCSATAPGILKGGFYHIAVAPASFVTPQAPFIAPQAPIITPRDSSHGYLVMLAMFQV